MTKIDNRFFKVFIWDESNGQELYLEVFSIYEVAIRFAAFRAYDHLVYKDKIKKVGVSVEEMKFSEIGCLTHETKETLAHYSKYYTIEDFKDCYDLLSKVFKDFERR